MLGDLLLTADPAVAGLFLGRLGWARRPDSRLAQHGVTAADPWAYDARLHRRDARRALCASLAADVLDVACFSSAFAQGDISALSFGFSAGSTALVALLTAEAIWWY